MVEEGLRGGEGHADVELRDRDLDALRGERREVRLEAGRGELADDEVALEADTIERDVCGLEALDEVQHRCRLCARLLDVVVVDVQLRVGVGCPRCFERNRDVARVEGVEEDVLAPGTIVVERLC